MRFLVAPPASHNSSQTNKSYVGGRGAEVFGEEREFNAIERLQASYNRLKGKQRFGNDLYVSGSNMGSSSRRGGIRLLGGGVGTDLCNLQSFSRVTSLNAQAGSSSQPETNGGNREPSGEKRQPKRIKRKRFVRTFFGGLFLLAGALIGLICVLIDYARIYKRHDKKNRK